MKKTYSKPEIVFECFSLSTSLIANCEIIIDNQSKNICGYLADNGRFLFTELISGCGFQIDDDEARNGFCYDVPSESYNLFNS